MVDKGQFVISAPVMGEPDEGLVESMAAAREDGKASLIRVSLPAAHSSVTFLGLVRTLRRHAHPKWKHDRLDATIRIVGPVDIS